MVTFALPSEQDPLVFEKVGPKNSVGLVGLIKVHFSSTNPHYLEKEKKKKKTPTITTYKSALPKSISDIILPVFNEPNLLPSGFWLRSTHTQQSMGKAAVVFFSEAATQTLVIN